MQKNYRMFNAMPIRKVAIIGAGLAGATCAQQLQQAGCEVVVFDKARGVGGRLSTRRVTHEPVGLGGLIPLTFDHGAQYLTAHSPDFLAFLQSAEAAGVVAPWLMPHATYVAGQWQASPASPRPRYVGTPDMPNLIRWLLKACTTQATTRITQIAYSTQAHGWMLSTADGPLPGIYSDVVCAIPPAQAADLLASHNLAWTEALRAQTMAPCWTWMALTDAPTWPNLAKAGATDSAWQAATIQDADNPIAWIARNDLKPQRIGFKGHASWVVQASAAWTNAHVEISAELAASLLSKAWQDLLGSVVRDAHIHYQTAHRWLYAKPERSTHPLFQRTDAAWVDNARGLACCGDYLGLAAEIADVQHTQAAAAIGARAEHAWQSGMACAQGLLANHRLPR